MSRTRHFQVLVVGAGPVGLMAALELARQGIEVGIIDKGVGTTTRSYACVLHPQSVRLLQEAGVLDEALTRGTRLEHISFSEPTLGKIDLQIPDAHHENSFILVLPQSDLEEILRQRLLDFGVDVQWGQRLAELTQDHDNPANVSNPSNVSATIEHLSDTGKGYAIPHLDRIVSKTSQCSARFVIAADGRDSHLRQVLGIKQKSFSEAEYFAIYEFENEKWPSADVFIACQQGASSLFTRLPNGRGRWLTQCSAMSLDIETHLKDRLHLRIIDPAHDDQFLAELNASIQQRAPSLNLEAGSLLWHGVTEFPQCLSAQFGQGHCWMIGDAAHVSNPIGMHSMNVGLSEATDLARILAEIMDQPGDLDPLRAFESKYLSQWENHFGIRKPEKWIQALPATGEDLAAMLEQIQGRNRPANRTPIPRK